jgi:hypothetical protein
VKRHHKISLVLAAVVLAVYTGATLLPRLSRAVGPCPCSIWSTNPSVTAITDGHPIEVGVKFSSDTGGYITGVKFYKATGMGGDHVGYLWNQYGQKLAEANFGTETATGWQTVTFANPVKITANVLYVAGTYMADGQFVKTVSGLSTAVDNSSLHVPADATAGAMDGFNNNHNGMYVEDYVGYPVLTSGAGNYWVDVVFDTTATDTLAPLVSETQPTTGTFGASRTGPYTVKFNEMMDSTTITTSTITLKTAAGAIIPATVAYDTALDTASLTPNSALAAGAYTVTAAGGGGAAVKDLAGNPLAADSSWSFTVGGSASITPGTGPGGPILVITSSANHYTHYLTEILRAEGYNEFATADISAVNATLLSAYKLAILGDMSLGAGQVSTLTTWVGAGGRLIASHPDKQLAGLLGLTDAGGTITDGYLKIDTSAAPGLGIESQTMQYHTGADKYTRSGAASVADLYTDATTPTAFPAVSLNHTGAGVAAAFTYDLAKSIVQQRQGNPAWVGQERDGVTPIRPDDMFYPNWVDLSKAAIPQADEQQRLLANLIVSMTQDLLPLPHFWYFPKVGTNELPKAVLAMVMDDHGSASATAIGFNRLQWQSPAGCSVTDWTCYRGTSWLYTSTGPSDAQAAAYYHQGFDVGVHINPNSCSDWTLTQLQDGFTNDLAAFAAKYPSLPPQTGNRLHCIPWDDWASIPKTDLVHNIRLDMGYYYYPNTWIQDRPGFMTGSGLPMRFADTDGSLIDVYQQPTHLASDSGMTYPAAINTQLDNAVGSAGYYGVFGTHYDESFANFHQQLMTAAIARGVPMVSAQQLITWEDGRGASTVSNLSITGHNLSFDIAAAAGSTGMQAMLPVTGPTGTVTAVKLGGTVLSYTTALIKGVTYAAFPAAPGSYTACYGACNGAPSSPTPSSTPAPTPAPAKSSTTGHTSKTSSSPAATPSATPGATPSASPAASATPSPAKSPSSSPSPQPKGSSNQLILFAAAGTVALLALLFILGLLYARHRRHAQTTPT